MKTMQGVERKRESNEERSRCTKQAEKRECRDAIKKRRKYKNNEIIYKSIRNSQTDRQTNYNKVKALGMKKGSIQEIIDRKGNKEQNAKNAVQKKTKVYHREN